MSLDEVYDRVDSMVTGQGLDVVLHDKSVKTKSTKYQSLGLTLLNAGLVMV